MGKAPNEKPLDWFVFNSYLDRICKKLGTDYDEDQISKGFGRWSYNEPLEVSEEKQKPFSEVALERPKESHIQILYGRHQGPGFKIEDIGKVIEDVESGTNVRKALDDLVDHWGAEVYDKDFKGSLYIQTAPGRELTVRTEKKGSKLVPDIRDEDLDRSLEILFNI